MTYPHLASAERVHLVSYLEGYSLTASSLGFRSRPLLLGNIIKNPEFDPQLVCNSEGKRYLCLEMELTLAGGSSITLWTIYSMEERLPRHCSRYSRCIL